MKYNLTAIIFAVFFTACGTPQSLEEFREEGQGIEKSLLTLLKTIQVDEELYSAIPALTKHFDDLVDVMIGAHQWQESHPGARAPLMTKEAHELSSALSQELNRIYKLERGRLLIEKSQENSLQRLDTYLNQGRKRKIN